MSAQRLLEAAEGRSALALHHTATRLPHADHRFDAPPILAWTDEHGWLLAWRGPRPPGRVVIVARALDTSGQPIPTSSPFADRDGTTLWVSPLGDETIYLPWLGLPQTTTVHLDLQVFRVGRGTSEALTHHRLVVQGSPGLPWDAAAWASPMLTLARAIVHADGRIKPAEQRAVREFAHRLGLPASTEIDLLLPAPRCLRAQTRCATLRLSGWGRRTLLEELTRLSVACGHAGPAEQRVLLDIAQHLGAPAGTVYTLIDRFSRQVTPSRPDLLPYWGVLGLRPGASISEIKATWRTLVQRHHPDKARSTDEAERNTLLTARLNAAYRALIDEADDEGEVAPPPYEPPEEQAPKAHRAGPPSSRTQLPTHVITGLLWVALFATLSGVGLQLWQTSATASAHSFVSDAQ